MHRSILTFIFLVGLFAASSAQAAAILPDDHRPTFVTNSSGQLFRIENLPANGSFYDVDFVWNIPLNQMYPSGTLPPLTRTEARWVVGALTYEMGRAGFARDDVVRGHHYTRFWIVPTIEHRWSTAWALAQWAQEYSLPHVPLWRPAIGTKSFNTLDYLHVTWTGEYALKKPTPVPVPAALPLLATAVGGLWLLRRRRG